jgi:hypothetical protein
MTLTEAIFLVLWAWPRHVTDVNEPEDLRRVRLRHTAEAVSDATARATCVGPWATVDCKRIWKRSRSELAAAILAVGKHESHFAEYVGDGRCQDGPVGMQCDKDHRTGEFRARSYWQLHQSACPKLWEQEPGSVGELRVAASCTARLLAGFAASSEADCSDTSWSTVFNRYGGRRCSWTGGVKRAATMRLVLNWLQRPRTPAISPGS